MEKLLWWLIAGTKGGKNRGLIIENLQETPYNINQLAKKLNLDYKTVKHHMMILEDNKIVISSGASYGNIYFLTKIMEENMPVFNEIWSKFRNKNKGGFEE